MLDLVAEKYGASRDEFSGDCGRNPQTVPESAERVPAEPGPSRCAYDEQVVKGLWDQTTSRTATLEGSPHNRRVLDLHEGAFRHRAKWPISSRQEVRRGVRGPATRAPAAGRRCPRLLPGYPAALAKCPDLQIVARLPGRASIPPAGGRDPYRGRTDGLSSARARAVRTSRQPVLPAGRSMGRQRLRFARLSLAAAQARPGLRRVRWQPDVLHVNDWPGGLAPAYLRWDGAPCRPC